MSAPHPQLTFRSRPVADIRWTGEYDRMTLPRVFFDANAAGMVEGYWLGFDQSRKDLEALGDNLSEGLRVTIYMPNELEMDAILSFDSADGVWCAGPIEGTLVYLDGGT